jgi:hypothetical protein
MSQLVKSLPRAGRRAIRRPRHSFYLEQRPFQLQPALIAPVVAGDSIRKIAFEFRALTDPVVSPHVGWLGEFYIFYVRMSDLDEFAEVKKMLAGQTFTLDTAASTRFFNAAGYVNWLRMAERVIVREWFRNEYDVDEVYELDGVPVAGIWGTSWIDTAQEVDELAGSPNTDSYEGRWAAYQEMRQRGLVTMSYEEYLEQQGVEVPRQLPETVQQRKRPELIRFVREFVYPTLATDWTTGLPAAMCQWLVKDTMDKARFCDEPGFVIGLTCFRPKVYRTGQKTTGASVLRNDRLWSALSGSLADAPQERLLRVPANSTAPIATGAGVDLWVDVGAIATAGDQFWNVATPGNAAALPRTVDGEGRYLTDGAVIDSFFSGSNRRIIVDGVAQLSISSNIVEAVTD